jgi:serine/threonine protein phosphatase PrpC
MNTIGLSDIGLVREKNEDKLLIVEKLGLLVVCDGMGGHKGGEVASHLAIQTIEASIPLYNEREAVKWLNDSIHCANKVIKTQSQADPQLHEMGTTITAALIKDNELFVAHIGDSRLYIINEQGIEQVTRDHTLAEQMREDGLKLEQKSNNTYNHILTRALGIQDEVAIDNLVQSINADDIILLCTDGLTDMIPNSVIWSIVNDHKNVLGDAAQELLRTALKNGGYDNITLILARL